MSKPATPATFNGGVRHGKVLGLGRRRRDQPAERRHRDVGKPANIRLWLPLTPLWVVLAPFALLLAPLLMLVPPLLPDNRHAQAVRAALAARPYRTAFALGSVLFALSGLVVQVDAPNAHIRIRIL